MIKACLSSQACQSNTAVESIRQRSPNFTTNLVNSYMYNDTRVCACVRVCVWLCACVSQSWHHNLRFRGGQVNILRGIAPQLVSDASVRVSQQGHPPPDLQQTKRVRTGSRWCSWSRLPLGMAPMPGSLSVVVWVGSARRCRSSMYSLMHSDSVCLSNHFALQSR